MKSCSCFDMSLMTLSWNSHVESWRWAHSMASGGDSFQSASPLLHWIYGVLVISHLLDFLFFRLFFWPVWQFWWFHTQIFPVRQVGGCHRMSNFGPNWMPIWIWPEATFSTLQRGHVWNKGIHSPENNDRASSLQLVMLTAFFTIIRC